MSSMAGTDIYIILMATCYAWSGNCNQTVPGGITQQQTKTQIKNENPIKFSNSNIPNHETLLLK